MPNAPRTDRVVAVGSEPPVANATSVLFSRTADRERAITAVPPECFPDLCLDQITASILAGREQYELQSVYYAPLHDPADIAFRQEIMRDLERDELRACINRFAAAMRVMRESLSRSRQLRNPLQRTRWFLDAAQCYCAALQDLRCGFRDIPPVAGGLCRFQDHLERYMASARFTGVRDAAQRIGQDVASLRYSVLIDGLHVAVRRAEEGIDYGREIEDTFEPFQQDGCGEYRFEFDDTPDMNAVEGTILERVTRLWPDTFSSLQTFVQENPNFAESSIIAFDREIQFYLSYLEYLAPFRKAGLPFCYPRVSRESAPVFSRSGFDLALAARLLQRNDVPIPNDFQLGGDERILVISGPNQSGKTTFARQFGQLHYLASLGCPVPGSEAQLAPFDQIFTHFERGEPVARGRGKLQEDLIKMHAIIERTTPQSIVILNEVFSSTTARDASMLGRMIMKTLARLDVRGVWVTFIEELASASSKTVSMSGSLDPEHPARRAYKIQRGPSSGPAYALLLAETHGLSLARLRDRLAR